MTSHKIIMIRFTGLVLLVLSLLLIPTGHIYAQEEETSEGACAFTLREAQSLYDQGLIETIPDMLQGCIKDGFTKEERLNAYKLIILSYLFDDDQDMANEEMLAFLKRYPEYEITPTDPIEFTYLYNTYDTEHKLTYGVCFGGNMTHGFITEPFSVFDLNTASDQVYKPSGIGLSGGLRLNFLLATNLELSVEGIFNQNKFTNEQGTLFDFSTLAHTETHIRIDVPLTVTYDFPVGNLVPYLRAGGQMGYLLSAGWEGTRSYPDKTEIDPVSGGSLNVSILRKQINFWAVAGGGLKYKIPNGYVILDLRYNIGLTEQNDPANNRYTASDDVQNLINYYLYTDDNFVLNNFIISLGYQRTLYRPKKIKE